MFETCLHDILRHVYTMMKKMHAQYWKIIPCLEISLHNILSCLKACYIMYEDMFTQCFKHIYTMLEEMFIQCWKTYFHKIDDISTNV